MNDKKSFSEEKSIAVLGGGPAGISSSLILAGLGFYVFLLEKEEKLGGQALNYCCKATDKCGKCSVCLVEDGLLKVFAHPKIEIKTGAKIVSFTRKSGEFKLKVKEGNSESALKVSALLLATGFSPFDADLKRELGHSKYKNVITAYELEKMVRLGGNVKRLSDGSVPQNIAFIQCVGSRDESIGRGFCSKVCCSYALRLAKLIKTENPETGITVFNMDIQPTGKNFSALRKDCEDLNIRFIRGLPSKIYGYTDATDFRLRLLSTDSKEMVEEAFDLIVLSVGISPRKEALELANFFGIEVDKFGFYRAKDSPNSSSAEGIFLAGACHGPKDISGSIAHAKAAAFEVAKFLGGQ